MFKLGIGRTFQLTRLFMRLTVLENMLVATQRSEGWLRGVLRLCRVGVGAEPRALELLDFVGITRLAHEPAGNLSYGQRKLLELASLLVADPAILLLDEPAGGVNPTLIKHLGNRIRELNRAGKTILVVEHNMEFVMSLCSRITVLSQGSTLVAGTPAEVRTNPAVLDAYLGGDEQAAAARGRGRRRARRRMRAAPVEAGVGRSVPVRSKPAEGRCCSVQRCDRRLRRRRHPQAGHARGAARLDHLCRRTQRRRQVDADGDDQRAAAARAWARSASTARSSPGSPEADPRQRASRRSRRRTACSRT